MGTRRAHHVLDFLAEPDKILKDLRPKGLAEHRWTCWMYSNRLEPTEKMRCELGRQLLFEITSQEASYTSGLGAESILDISCVWKDDHWLRRGGRGIAKSIEDVGIVRVCDSGVGGKHVW